MDEKTVQCDFRISDHRHLSRYIDVCHICDGTETFSVSQRSYPLIRGWSCTVAFANNVATLAGRLWLRQRANPPSVRATGDCCAGNASGWGWGGGRMLSWRDRESEIEREREREPCLSVLFCRHAMYLGEVPSCRGKEIYVYVCMYGKV